MENRVSAGGESSGLCTESENECSKSDGDESVVSTAVSAVAVPAEPKEGRYTKRQDWNIIFSASSDTFKDSWDKCNKFMESEQKKEGISDYPFGKQSRRIYGWQIHKKGSVEFHGQMDKGQMILQCPYSHRTGCKRLIKVRHFQNSVTGKIEASVLESGEHDHASDRSVYIKVKQAKKIVQIAAAPGRKGNAFLSFDAS
jgi:hypothetical protein